MMSLDAAKPVDGLLVKLRRADAAGFAVANRMAMGGSATPEVILTVPAAAAAERGFADHPNDAVWARMASGANAWDDAHRIMRQGFAAASGVIAAEPDLGQVWRNGEADAPGLGVAADDRCSLRLQTDAGGRAIGPGSAWHRGDAFSGLASAAAQVGDAAQRGVRIAHLDTGYDPAHSARPAHLLTGREANFVTGEGAANSAADVTPTGGIPFTRARGHGTGTLSILASPQFGGAPGAEIVAVRIADGVVRFSTSTMVQGIEHALANGAQVLSMSMGGYAGGALADAVNKAYEAGLTMVTAAGNNFAGLPIRSVVYPARMRRVIAATGTMADGRPYFDLVAPTMQGCWGPDLKMATALAGFSPNIPWAAFKCGDVVHEDGQGTSAATPQVAAAAALWIALHQGDPVYQSYSQGWMRVEAVRRALFAAARKTTAKLDAAGVLHFLGTGALDALAALAVGPAAASGLRAEPPASAAWAWVKLLSGEGVGFALASAPRANALGLELMQLAQRTPEIEAALLGGGGDPDGALPEANRKAFFEAVLDSGAASQLLTTALTRSLGLRDAAPPPAPPPLPGTAPLPGQVRMARRDPVPAQRRLRVFALDPSLGASLDTVAIGLATVNIPYETGEDGKSILRPGPVGEYLEVVDVDPASDRAYDPVDLDHPHLLISDGLEPSEGNPRFHQQMVYAIGMKTIGHFEAALGRKALWAPRRYRRGIASRFEYVQRLRIYPHALRAQNAYYSPSKVALLFGYFPAASARTDATVRGSMVFSCLSADIVAHEMTHALLDGVHRHYQEASNPDVGAFHEGFADIVALFQHFTYGDIVSAEIARARGEIGAARLLSGLARQFGEGAGKAGPLRDYIDPATGTLDYSATTEVHSRGSILVFAIYEAFVAIVERRTGDLIRLATGGTGVLPAGDLHPGLVTRLTRETCKAASQVLRICIRAIDYCPPNDITFGEYLRALLTADVDQVPDDRLGYRTALLQAFRKHDLLPPRLRTVSIESLVWRHPIDPHPPWFADAVRDFAIDWANNSDRWTSFKLVEQRRFDLQLRLKQVFADDPGVAASFGLQHGLPRYGEDGIAIPGETETCFSVHSLRRVRRVRPDGEVANQIVAVIAQRRAEPVDPAVPIDKDDPNSFFWFRGGATLIIDPAVSGSYPPRAEIRYCVVKHMLSTDRLARQRAMAGGPATGLRAQYFDTRALARREPFAMLHAEDPA